MSMTTCFVVSYVPFAVSVTFVANTVLEVATRSGVTAAAADASGQKRSLVEVMSPLALVILTTFWTVLGVLCSWYADGPASKRQAHPAKREFRLPYFVLFVCRG